MKNKSDQIEQGLLVRLKWTIYILIALSLISLCFAMWIAQSSQDAASAPAYSPERIMLEQTIPPNFFLDSLSEEIELEATDVINFYWLSLTFAAVALFCHLFIRHTKRRI